MLSILKNPKNYILNNSEFKSADKALYGFITEDFSVCGELDSSERYTRNSLTFNTSIGQFIYKPSDSIKSKKQLDFSDILFSEYKAKEIQVGDYLRIPFSTPSNTLNPTFRLTPYLYSSKYDLSHIDPSFVSKIGVPEWFLLKYLICGVPDHERYNNLIDIYLIQNQLSSDDFKLSILKEYTHSVSPNLKITKGFINLALANLSGLCKVENNSVSFKLDSFDDTFVKDILSLLEKLDIKYSITETKLIIKSYLIYMLFTQDFGNYRFFSTLCPILKNRVLLYLKLFKSVTGKHLSLLYVQDFLNRNGKALSYISSFDSTYSVLYLLKESEDYIKTEEEFLLPILSIEEIEYSSLLQLNIREPHDY